jgi:hypothetical protein
MSVYYFVMHYLIKTTFLTFYLRLSPNRKFRLWVGFGFGINTGSLLINILIIVFQCVPISAALSTAARLTARCMDRNFVFIAPAVVVSAFVSLKLVRTDRDLRMSYSTSLSSCCQFPYCGDFKCREVKRSLLYPSSSSVLQQYS